MEDGFLKNKTIFITGAGSIGSAIIKKILEYDIDSIRIFDNSELKLHNIEQLYRNNPKVKTMFGDIRDKARLATAMRGVDVVFHTAAMKHVSICENNPVDAVSTNVLGTQNLIDIAIQESCDKVVNISTDKAVDPCNVMGATKLLTERLVKSANEYKGKIDTSFTSIRFGNVIASSGSVIEIFMNQIKNGNPLTITDPDMERYMMSIDDAVDLILKSVSISKESDIFILKMPKVRIIDLAKVIMKDKNIDIEIIGRTKGEKLDEKLISNNEVENVYENDEMYVIVDEEFEDYYKSKGFTKLSSIEDKILSIDEIEELLENDKNICDLADI